MLDDIDVHLHLDVNEATWLLYKNLKNKESVQKEVDEELLKCRREGGEHRAACLLAHFSIGPYLIL